MVTDSEARVCTLPLGSTSPGWDLASVKPTLSKAERLHLDKAILQANPHRDGESRGLRDSRREPLKEEAKG